MLIARAPVRLSFAGGGTDLAAYYRRRPGMVVSATLNKYFYVFATPTDEPHVQIASSDFRTFQRVRNDEPPLWDSDLALPRVVLRQFGVTSGIHLFLASEVPPGTGLGSSSSVTVALIKAISTLTRQPLDPAAVAEAACAVEIDLLGAPIGKQDQYAAAFGGFNAFTFTPDGVQVEPLTLDPSVRRGLEERVLLFFTGSSRKASTILREQRQATEDRADVARSLDLIAGHAVRMRQLLLNGDLDGVGALLHESWEQKRQLAPGVSNDHIDRLYTLARVHGATGGKIAGAGGGGFLMLYTPPAHREAVTEVLEGEGLLPMDFRFEQGGARVLVNTMSAPVMPVTAPPFDALPPHDLVATNGTQRIGP